MKKHLIALFALIVGLSPMANAYRDLETGTFLTRDPIGFADGPNVYCYVHCNPITHFDPLGLKINVQVLPLNTTMQYTKVKISTQGKRVKKKVNLTGFSDASVDSVKSDTQLALNYVAQVSEASDKLKALINNPNYQLDIKVHNTPDSPAIVFQQNGKNAGRVLWNPKASLEVPNGKQSPAMALFHEIGHGYQHMKKHISALFGSAKTRKQGVLARSAIENVNTDLEERVARELGEPHRKRYADAKGVKFDAVSSTFSEKKGAAPSLPSTFQFPQEDKVETQFKIDDQGDVVSDSNP